jgi:NADH dehydrogenase
VGDIEAPEGSNGNPQLAQVAMQGGTHVGQTILRAIEGREPEPFVYHDKGKLAVVGRNAAVAENGWLKITGFPAWVAWAGVHIYQLIGFRNRLAVLLNWAWDYVFFERGVRVILPSGLEASKRETVDKG